MRSLHREAFTRAKQNPDSSLILLSKAQEVSIRKGYSWEEAFGTYLFGRTYMLSNNDSKALHYLSLARHQFSTADTIDLYNEYVMYWNMARVTYRNRSYKAAIQYYDSAFHTLFEFKVKRPLDAKKMNVSGKLENVLYFKSLSLKKEGDIEQATKTLTGLIEMNPENTARVYNQIGLISKDLGDYDQARNYFERISSDTNNSLYYLALTAHNLGYLSLLENKSEEAEKYLKSASKLSKDLLIENDAKAN